MNKAKRKPIIAGNWKMNKNRAEAKELINALIPLCKDDGAEVIICPPFTNLETAVTLTKDTIIKVGAQNCHFEEKGAFTGEISADMLCEMGVSYVIIGHSERRQYFAESDETVSKRMKTALAKGLSVILCVGETLEERELDITKEVINRQLKVALFGVEKSVLDKLIIAYEPVWAIGTGKTATSGQAEEVCAMIRDTVEGLYDTASADAMRVLYGGSMNANNADELLSMENIDGGLIGGAALKAPDFSAIINSACKN